VTRTAGKTALILGENDVADLRVSVANAIEFGEELGEDEIARLERLLRRLNDAARRLARGRNGRSEAAR
jgi:hypothetical protein